jgi:hypothetical protein
MCLASHVQVRKCKPLFLYDSDHAAESCSAAHVIENQHTYVLKGSKAEEKRAVKLKTLLQFLQLTVHSKRLGSELRI